MGGLGRRKRVVGWLAAIALLSNVLAMALLAPSAAITILDDVLGPIVLCTASGAKALSGDGPGPGEHSPSKHCPACVTLAQFALAVAIIDSAVAFPQPSAARPAPSQPRLVALHLSGGIGPRAPPLSA